MGKKEGGAKLTPMMQQYQRLRRSLPEDVLLFYRLGDFYELFFTDAQAAAGILDVALTKRNGMPMCGVPHHAAKGYIAKLITAGKRVAIAEQTSEPDLIEKIGLFLIRRSQVRVLPGVPILTKP